MGLFDFFRKQGNPYISYRVEYDPPEQHICIMRNCLAIMQKTVNPETYFSNGRLASNKAAYCISYPGPVWNGMTCRQIYDMLNNQRKKDMLQMQFIDRLFEAGKEDRMTFQMYDISFYMSRNVLQYFVRKLNGKKYHFCKVGFENTSRLYTYVTKTKGIKPGDAVVIPVGNGVVPDTKLKQVVAVFDASLEELGFTVDKLRCVEEKLRKIVCPHCGAPIEVSVGHRTGKCTRCGSEFYLIS